MILKFAPDRLGRDRLYGAYAWQSLLETGAIIVGGSDAPVEVGTPQIEFYAAVARKDLEGFSTEDWYPRRGSHTSASSYPVHLGARLCGVHGR